MIKKILSTCILLFATSAVTATPTFFTKEIDNEYRALIKHVNMMLPETNKQLLYLPSFYPFSLLDVRPTKFHSNKDKQSFANFNFGVFGTALLNVNEKQLNNLPNFSICKKSKCQNERIKLIKEFLKDAAQDIDLLIKSNDLYIVQQTTPSVYRINNTFYSPTQLITYYPSDKAGFVPSADYQLVKPNEAPQMMALSKITGPLRAVMSKHDVAAITKIDEESVNVIFGGISDNHWGVVLYHKATVPSSGDYNHLGLEYDIVKQISHNSFYYQTN